jgi:hypothetical protein
MLWADPTQRDGLAEIRDNLIARIAEAEREGWLGEVEGLHVSLAGASDRLAQIDKGTNPSLSECPLARRACETPKPYRILPCPLPRPARR